LVIIILKANDVISSREIGQLTRLRLRRNMVRIII